MLTLNILGSLLTTNSELHAYQWQQVIGRRHTSLALLGPSPDVVYLGNLTGDCKLHKHLYQLDIVPDHILIYYAIREIVNDPMYRDCEKENQAMEHVLCHCPVVVTNSWSHASRPVT